jgi:hypothetical protein
VSLSSDTGTRELWRTRSVAAVAIDHSGSNRYNLQLEMSAALQPAWHLCARSTRRPMGSIAMDKNGDIALGYSKSNAQN